MNDLDELFQHYWLIKNYGNDIKGAVPVILSSGDPRFEAENPKSEQLRLYFSELRKGARVLDIGAGDKQIGRALEIRGIGAEYLSQDSAHRGDVKYDFGSIDEISGSYDLVIMQEVIEHMPLEMGYRYLKKAYSLLNPAGHLVVTTPSTRRPLQFHHADFTHVQHYPLRDLYGLLRVIGFSGPAVVRMIEIAPPSRSLGQIVRSHVQKLLFKLLDFGYPHAILIKIGKSREGTGGQQAQP